MTVGVPGWVTVSVRPVLTPPYTLALPTRAMEREAAAAGLFESPFEKVPKIQIITLAELFQGIRPRIPRIDAAATFRAAGREVADAQGRLL